MAGTAAHTPESAREHDAGSPAGEEHIPVSELTPTLSENPSAEEIHAFFKGDTFAYKQANCRITESSVGHGKAEMTIVPEMHFNAEGHIMGGAVFTLADYAFAAAVMPGSVDAVTLSSTIEFIGSSRGSKLIAECNVDRSGNKVGFYTTEVTDDTGRKIAKVVSTCYKPTTL